MRIIKTDSIDNELNIIDFSNGIRPEEIQENFEILEKTNVLTRDTLKEYYD